jgi:hypothetical protein
VTAHEVLAEVLRAGGRIIPDPEHPRLVVPAELKPLVLEHREELRELVRSSGPSGSQPARAKPLAELLDMPLGVFAQEGSLLEIRVHWYPQTLWLVPAERDAAQLERDGISRGRIWTAQELIDVFAISKPTWAHIKTVALTKLQFSGEVVTVQGRSDASRGPSANQDHAPE